MTDLKGFIASDIETVRQLCAIGRFDYIIVGSGIGGGVLADQLASRKKKVLLLEKGHATWSTHVVNTARPSYARGKDDSPEGNETIFNNLHAPVQTTPDSETFVGGPLFTLGGKTNVWGLWIPRADNYTLADHFPSAVANDLKSKYFDESFKLLTNGSQKDDPNDYYPNGFIPKDVLEESMAKVNKELQSYIVDKKEGFKIGPVAIQFDSPSPYVFAQGAYSSTTALLNRIYARDQYLTVLMDADVLHLDVPRPDENTAKVVRHISVRHTPGAQDSRIYQFPVAGNTKVVLSAGTLPTADIALRSGLKLYQPKVGRGLIDHAAYAWRVAQKIHPDPRRHTKFTHSPLLLQTLINVLGVNALLSITVNYNFFLATSVGIHQFFDHEGKHMPIEDGRKAIKEHNFNTVSVFLEFGAHLNEENHVIEDATIPPTIRFQRTQTYTDEKSQEQLQVLCTKIRDAVLSLVSGTNFSDPDHPAPRPTLLGPGIYAHEVGTMRMPTVSTSSGKRVEEPGVVDTNLKFKGLDNLYVSDLSVFPYSTPANPTHTLTSVVLRLVDHLAPVTSSQ